ncbi:MAG: 3-isopropylmalate dehydratase small subunit [Chitinispirillaceae bacterium]|nr:3-isopropylmalate dehydratase small subunit [Chitinispirillaceae bacterium]
MATTERFIKKVEGTVIPIPGEDIDTDRIIPARYMKVITFDGLGDHAFHDERFDEQGTPKPHPFNDERYAGGSILLVESNFGCGSSREHAPQALMRYGIRALVGISFADIFAGNCTQMGIPVVRISREDHRQLSQVIEQDPAAVCTVNLIDRTVIAGTTIVSCSIDEAAGKALVSGLWDTTSLLLENRDGIDAKAAELPYCTW